MGHHPIRFRFHGSGESIEEREARKKREARLDAQYARGAKEQARARSKQKPLRKGEVRKYVDGKWVSNKD